MGIKDMKILLTLFISSFFALSVFADTTDQKWMNKVEVTKKGDHCADDINCFNRYHPAIPAVAKANPGDIIIIHSRDALDSQFRLD